MMKDRTVSSFNFPIGSFASHKFHLCGFRLFLYANVKRRIGLLYCEIVFHHRLQYPNVKFHADQVPHS